MLKSTIIIYTSLFFAAFIFGQENNAISTENKFHVGLTLPLGDNFENATTKYYDLKYKPNYKVGGMSFYPNFLPGIYASLTQKGRFQHGLDVRYAQNSGENLYGMEEVVDFRFQHYTLSYSFDYLFFNFNRLKKNILSPFIGSKVFLSYLDYYNKSIRTGMTPGGSEYNIDYLNLVLQGSFGAKFKFKKLLIELVYDFNLIGLLHNKTNGYFYHQQYPITSPPDRLQNNQKGTDLIHLKQFTESKTLLNAISFKIAYQIGSSDSKK